MKFFVESYGCTMNFGEGRMLSEKLAQLGHEEVSSADEAELIVLNTCTVTGITEKRMISRISELKKEKKKIAVTGCMAAVLRQRVEIRVPDSPIIAPKNYPDFSQEIESRFGVAGPPKETIRNNDAILPIAQGCLGNCSFCITRLARGALKSYDPGKLFERFSRFVDQGIKEILITAQDTACYGKDIGTDLPNFLSLLLKKEGNYRVRIGMMNPNALEGIYEKLLDVMEKDERVYRFLHIPIQSGSDQVLERMNRRFTVSRFFSLVENIRKRIPDISIATDVICGFPGESEEDHKATIDLIEKMNFDTINITRFSARPGTPAAEMEQIHGRISHDRSLEITQVKNRVELEVNKKLIGRQFVQLATEIGKEGTILRTNTYRPVVVREDVKLGSFCNVQITGAKETYLTGKIEAKIS